MTQYFPGLIDQKVSQYCPDATVTRGQLAAMLRRALDIAPDPANDTTPPRTPRDLVGTIEDNGDVTLEFTYDRAVLEIQSPQGATTFDSATSDEGATDNPMNMIIGKPIGVTLSDRAQVKGVKSMNEMGHYMFSRYAGKWIPDAPGDVWGTVLEGDYPTDAGEALTSPTFSVDATTYLVEITHYYDAENLWDGGNVKVNGQEIAPLVEAYESQNSLENPEILKPLLQKLEPFGLLSGPVAEADGGMALPYQTTGLVFQKLAEYWGSLWGICTIQCVCARFFAEIENDGVREMYLPQICAGQRIACICITEPDVGSNPSSIATTLAGTRGGFLLNGSKTFITNGVYSDYLVVAAKTDPNAGGRGISIFIMDRDTPGISATKLDKLGWRASDTGEIAFDNVRVHQSQLMGEEGKGFSYLMQHLALERLIMAINAHARSEWALEYTIDYMKQREAFGKSISTFQALRHKIADLSAEVELCKSFNYQTAHRLGQKEYVVKEASMAKLVSTKVADEVANECLNEWRCLGVLVWVGTCSVHNSIDMSRLRDKSVGEVSSR